MAKSPYTNVAALWALAGAQAPFQGGLTTAPHDWSLAISYSTPAMGMAIYQSAIGGGSSSTIDLDRNSRVWFPSNKSGDVGIGYFDPTTNTFNGPFGGTSADLTFPLVLPQYVALDDFDDVAWISDSLSGALLGVSTSPGSEGDVVANTAFQDPYGGGNTKTLGPFFVNSDESLVLNYDTTTAVPIQVTYDPFHNSVLNQSNFTLQPTGLTVNTTQGSDPNDPAKPVAIAVTSDLSTACNVEFSSFKDGNVVLINNTSCDLSGGIATTRYNAANGNQDQIAALTSANALCSEIKETCSSLPEFLSSPEGVAVDGDNEVWIANRDSASIFYLFGSYETGGTPSYSEVSNLTLLHDASNGNTMTQPTGIAVDRGGNIWVSNTSCANTGDTSCSFTLSEVFGTAYPTLTPLSLQADRLQGLTPPEGSILAGGTPHPMVSRGSPAGLGSLLPK